jgi:hypothetical protein
MIAKSLYLLVIHVFVLLLMTTQSFGNYCTQKNFDTGVNVYSQSRTSHQKAVDISNTIIVRYNKEVFTHRRFTIEQMTTSMSQSDDSLAKSIQHHVERLEILMNDATKAQRYFENAKKRIPTAIGIWEKIAASCSAQEESTNVRYARENVEFSKELLLSIDENYQKHQEIQAIYQKEIDFLHQVLTSYRAYKHE